MAVLICPICNKQSFTWSIDNVNEELTRWGCFNCNVQYFEDEAEGQYMCKTCGERRGLHIKDENGDYLWCDKCNTLKPFTKDK